MIRNFTELVKFASTFGGQRVVVVNPTNAETFAAITSAIRLLHVKVTMVGNESLIREALQRDSAIDGVAEIVATDDVTLALQRSIEIVRAGNAEILMKGSINTSEMMRSVLREQGGLRTGRLLSDIFVLEYPPRVGSKFVMITDGGMTLAPDLKNKVELVRNAVEVAHALGNTNPRVAILSATEFVLQNLPSTLDAAALSKMNDRGQIKGCVVDGPLALDNALSEEAAREKGIRSPVAGCADILVAANIESANSLAKSTTYFANLPLAHVIVGGKVPVLIPSRADKGDAKLFSIALGMVMSRYNQVLNHRIDEPSLA